MGKDKKKADGLSKDERKALKKREAALAAELAEREAAAEKPAKKAKKSKGDDSIDPQRVIIEADKVIDGKGSAPDSIAKAKRAKARAEAELAAADAESDDDIKARVHAKRAKREAEAAAETVDRSDAAAVTAYNETHGRVTGSYLTSDAEREALSQRLHQEEAIAELTTPPKTVPGDIAVTDPLYSAMIEQVTAAVEQVEQVVEEVETDRGRVFEAGTSEASTPDEGPALDTSDPVARAIAERGFAVPSDAKVTTFEENGNGQYKVKRPADGKIVGYTRVTTFIDCLEDKSMLVKWSKRHLVEGVLLDMEETGTNAGGVDLLGRARDLVHNRDVAFAKARKADRKGKLGTGELAQRLAEAGKVYKDQMNVVIDEFEELAGIHDKANKGTELHTLCELYDNEGIDAVGALLEAGTISPADLADVEAYAAAMERADVKVLENEVMVVNDEKKRAGRLDKVVMVRFPGAKRAVKAVADIKTGSIDFGVKIPLQLENYADMKAYDPSRPDERRDLKLSRTKAVVIHLPAGTAECHIYPVDLATGRIGNKLAEDVRAFRNTGKRGIDKTVDMADPEAVAAYVAKLEGGE